MPTLRQQTTLEKMESSYAYRKMEGRTYNSLCFSDMVSGSYFTRMNRAEYCCGSNSASVASKCFNDAQVREVCCQPHLHRCADFAVRDFPSRNVVTDDLFRDFRHLIHILGAGTIDLFNNELDGLCKGKLAEFVFGWQYEDPAFCAFLSWIEQNLQTIFAQCPEMALVARALISTGPMVCVGEHGEIPYSVRLSLLENVWRQVADPDAVMILSPWARSIANVASLPIKSNSLNNSLVDGKMLWEIRMMRYHHSLSTIFNSFTSEWVTDSPK